jgi:predicted nucleic-acid-binding protein
MIALDTNVLVRFLTGDDPKQTRKVEGVFAHHVNAPGGVFVSLVVLVELAWVLRAKPYKWTRQTVHARLSRLVGTRGVVVEEGEIAAVALERYGAGQADLADYLILGKAGSVGAELFTFDKRLARESGVRLL